MTTIPTKRNRSNSMGKCFTVIFQNSDLLQKTACKHYSLTIVWNFNWSDQSYSYLNSLFGNHIFDNLSRLWFDWMDDMVLKKCVSDCMGRDFIESIYSGYLSIVNVENERNFTSIFAFSRSENLWTSNHFQCESHVWSKKQICWI